MALETHSFTLELPRDDVVGEMLDETVCLPRRRRRSLPGFVHQCSTAVDSSNPKALLRTLRKQDAHLDTVSRRLNADTTAA
jgi:hypothetical protein